MLTAYRLFKPVSRGLTVCMGDTMQVVLIVGVAVATVWWWQQLLSVCAARAYPLSGPNVRKWQSQASAQHHPAL